MSIIDHIAIVAQILGAITFVTGFLSYLNDHNSLIALPCYCVAGICIIITIVCERIVA